MGLKHDCRLAKEGGWEMFCELQGGHVKREKLASAYVCMYVCMQRKGG